MNEAVPRKRDYSGLIGIAIVVLLLAVLLPLSINALAAERPDFTGAYQLELDQAKRARASSPSDFPVFSFSPSESGEYSLVITTSPNMHIDGIVDVYSRDDNTNSITNEGAVWGESYFTNGVGYQFNDLNLAVGKTYYFVTFQDSRYSFSPGILECLITKTADNSGDEDDLDNFYVLSLNQRCSANVNSPDDFPIFLFAPHKTGEYIMQIATSSGLHMSGNVYQYSMEEDSDTVDFDGVLSGQLSSYSEYTYDNLYLEAGKIYAFETLKDNYYYDYNSFLPGTIDCIIQSKSTSPDFNAVQLTLDNEESIWVKSKDSYPILSFTPVITGQYTLQLTTSSNMLITTASNLVVDRSLDEYVEKSNADIQHYVLSGDCFSSVDGRHGYEYKNLKLEAGSTYYFVTKPVDGEMFNPGVLNCLITGTKKDPVLSAKDVTGTYGDTGLKVKASTVGGSPLRYEVTAGENVVSVNSKTGALTVKGAGTATVTVTAAETHLYCEATKDVTVTIRKATITIQAKDKSVAQGKPAPKLGSKDYTVTGLVNGEQLAKAPTIRYETTPDTSVPGRVAIKVSGAEAPNKNNYKIKYIDGVLTIRGNQPFTDIKDSAYYYDAVVWAVNHDPQITNGTSDTKFSPEETCTRGQVVTFLWRANGCPEPGIKKNPFKDVKASAYYYQAVLWAVENGITNGTSDTAFSPNDPCTRAHVVTFLWRSANRPEPGIHKNPFKDVKSGQYYSDAVLWAVEKEITNGTSADKFSPNSPCTRGQIVTFLYRYMK